MRETEDGEELVDSCVCLPHVSISVSSDDNSSVPQAFPIQNRNRDNATVQHCNPRIHDGIWLCLFAAYSATT